MAELFESTIIKLKKEFGITTREQLAEIGDKKKQLYIGIPKETYLQERRIPLTPNAVRTLTILGHRIAIEMGAGEASSFTNEEYLEAGAEVVYSRKEVYQAEMILKSTPPNNEDIESMNLHQVIFSPLLMTSMTADQLKHMAEKRICAFAFEYIKDENHTFPFIRS
ncbi:MAG TPA: hypothetical protein VEB42_05790 [Chitinophagaceae bacterium]|nr:hypothetical protein [Chitinophagaceae bacterium]